MTRELNTRRRFLAEYRCIRYAEGRGSDEPAYYLGLPYRDLTGRNSSMWAMRARTYQFFENRILAPVESRIKRPLNILDLGAGNGWMSYRLSLRNHQPVALDIFTDEKDGLRAARHYPHVFPLIEADFHHLPFDTANFDLVIYNSSFHYATDYGRALSEARRCLRKAGVAVILDTPVYRCRDDGERMVAERHADFLARYGFRSDAIPSIEFLDEAMLATLSRSLNVRWNIYRPWYGWQWHLRPLKALLQRRRTPSRFWILTARFDDP